MHMQSTKKKSGIHCTCPECQVSLLKIWTDFATAYLVCRNRRCKKDVLLTVNGDDCTLVAGSKAKDRDRDAFSTIRCPNCNRFVMDIITQDATVSVVCADKRCKGSVGIEVSENTLSVSVSK